MYIYECPELNKNMFFLVSPLSGRIFSKILKYLIAAVLIDRLINRCTSNFILNHNALPKKTRMKWVQVNCILHVFRIQYGLVYNPLELYQNMRHISPFRLKDPYRSDPDGLFPLFPGLSVTSCWNLRHVRERHSVQGKWDRCRNTSAYERGDKSLKFDCVAIRTF